jgi:hypothetical protein
MGTISGKSTFSITGANFNNSDLQSVEPDLRHGLPQQRLGEHALTAMTTRAPRCARQRLPRVRIFRSCRSGQQPAHSTAGRVQCRRCRSLTSCCGACCSCCAGPSQH